MSRSVADYLVKEDEFEKEYKKNFCDKIVDENENSPHNMLEEEYQKELEDEQKNLKINKLYKYFLEIKKECVNMGYLQNMSFLNFCNLIGEKNIFNKN